MPLRKHSEIHPSLKSDSNTPRPIDSNLIDARKRFKSTRIKSIKIGPKRFTLITTAVAATVVVLTVTAATVGLVLNRIRKYQFIYYKFIFNILKYSHLTKS